MILTSRYIKAHTSEKVYERMVSTSEKYSDGALLQDDNGYGAEGDFYGIGIEADEGMMFCFHRKIETFEVSPKE